MKRTGHCNDHQGKLKGLSPEVSAIEIAQKQRYVYLLGKVQQNQPLSRAEVEELKRYEMTRPSPNKQPLQPQPAPDGTGRKTVSLAEVRMLGLNSDSLTEAAAAFSGPGDLQGLIEKRPKVRAAWERGRLLRIIRGQASITVTVSQAAKELDMTGKELRELLDTDREAADLWSEQRRLLRAELNAAMVAQAKEGRPNAVRYVENFLRSEQSVAGFDYEHVPIAVMVEITGRARQTIHNWYRDGGLPRNPDGTYNLVEFLKWFATSIATRSKTAAPSDDGWRQAKTEGEWIKIREKMGTLMDRTVVENGMVTRMQTFLAAIENLLPATATACARAEGDLDAVEAHLRSFCDRLRASLCELPAELCLPRETAEAFRDFLGRLEPAEEAEEEVEEPS